MASRCRCSPDRLPFALSVLGENAVLLCWEKPWDACHRCLVAEWLEAALGLEIPEHGFDRIAYSAYDEMI
jgi:hypothetical protein